MLKHLILRSTKFDYSNRDLTSLTEDFIKQFLNPNELLIQKDVLRFNDGKTTNESSLRNALKHEHVLFLLDKDTYIKQMRNDCRCKLIDSFKAVLKVFKDNYKSLAVKINSDKHDVLNLIISKEEKMSSGILTIEQIRREVLSFNQSIKGLRNNLFKSEIKTEYNKQFSEKMKELHKIIDVVDGLMSCDCKTHMFALVSSAGVIQISIVKESYVDSKIQSDTNLIYNKSLITEASRVADIITSRINKLPKIFSIMDFNRYFGFATEPKPTISIFDHPRRLVRKYDLVDCEEVNSLYGKTSPQKSLFLRMNVTKNDKNFKNISLDFFNYVSLLIAYSHSYDKYSLLKYCIENSKYKHLINHEEDKKFQDHIGKTTEHLYIDDSLAVLSVIDESENIEKFKNYICSKRHYAKKDPISHQLRFYSFWDYIYVCNAQAFGSSAIIVNALLINYVKTKIANCKLKQVIHIKQARLGRIVSRIASKYNHTFLNIKVDSKKISLAIFKEMGLIDIENQLNVTTDIVWRSANLMSSQNYSRLGFLLTFMGLFITVVSYGLIAITDTNGTSPDNYCGLMSGIFANAPKIPVVLTFAAIPVIIYLVWIIVEHIISRVQTRSLTKLNGFKQKGGRCIKKID